MKEAREPPENPDLREAFEDREQDLLALSASPFLKPLRAKA